MQRYGPGFRIEVDRVIIFAESPEILHRMNNLQYLRGAIDAGGCVSNAWTLVTRQFWLYIGIGLLTVLLISCVPIVNFFLMGPMLGGFYYIVLRDMRGDPVDFGMLFKGFEKFVPLMVVGLIQSAPSIVITIIQYTVDIARLAGGRGPLGDDINFFQPGSDVLFAGLSAVVVIVGVFVFFFAIAWHLAFSFAVPLVIDREAEIADALITSLKAATSNVGGLILLLILQMLISLLGFIALCVGIFVAIPVIYAANVFAYRMVFPYFDRPFDAGPPPPEAYGFGRGQR